LWSLIVRSEGLNIPHITTRLESLDAIRRNQLVRRGRVVALGAGVFRGTNIRAGGDPSGQLGALVGQRLVLTAPSLGDLEEGVRVVQDVSLHRRGIAGLAEDLRLDINHDSRNVLGELREYGLRVRLSHLEETGVVEGWMRHVEALGEGEHLDGLVGNTEHLDKTITITITLGEGSSEATQQMESKEGEDDREDAHLGGLLKKHCQE
jgi:hypothetical protein